MIGLGLGTLPPSAKLKTLQHCEGVDVSGSSKGTVSSSATSAGPFSLPTNSSHCGVRTGANEAFGAGGGRG